MAENEIPISFKWYLNRQGIQGQQGERGEEGFSPTITVNEDTLTAYTLKVQNKTGSFVTPNLRQVVSDSGGTYVRYDRTSGNLYAGNADFATTEQAGIVRFCTEEELNSAYDGSVVSPADLVDYLTNTYQLPIATAGQIGAVKPDGTTITIDPDGTIHGASTYNLPTASATVLGGIKVGENLTITEDGTLSASGGGGTSLENVSTITDGISIGNQDAVTTGYKSKVEIAGSNKDNGFPIPTIQLIGDKYEDSIRIGRQGVFLGVNEDKRLSIFSSDPNNIPSTGNFILSSIDIGVDVTGGSSKFYINGTTTQYANGWQLGQKTTSLLPETGALKYWKGTAEQYAAIASKNVDTLYNVTDTQQVYLGTIPLTGGGGNVTPAMYAGIPAGGQNTGYVGKNTVTTYDPPTT